MRDDLWSPSVAFISGRLFCNDADSNPRLQNSDYDVDDRLIIKKAAIVVKTHITETGQAVSSPPPGLVWDLRRLCCGRVRRSVW
jgi:hypothetical protein